MRKYLLPSLLILGLTGTIAIGQTVNKALQLSQDASGAFGVDTTNNVYFPGHILANGNAAPTPTISGTGVPTIAGNDVQGIITMGTSGTTATAIFGRAFVTAPTCVASTNVTLASPLAITAGATNISITQPATSGNKVSYICLSAS